MYQPYWLRPYLTLSVFLIIGFVVAFIIDAVYVKGGGFVTIFDNFCR